MSHSKPVIIIMWLGLFGCACISGHRADAPAPSEPLLQFSHQVRTTADPAAIWAYWTDIEGWPDWDTELRSARLRDPLGPGARGRLVPKRGVASSFVISEYEPMQRYAFMTKLPRATLTVRRYFVADAGPGVVFVHEVEFTGPRAARWATRLAPSFRRALPGVMRSLASLAERRGGTR